MFSPQTMYSEEHEIKFRNFIKDRVRGMSKIDLITKYELSETNYYQWVKKDDNDIPLFSPNNGRPPKTVTEDNKVIVRPTSIPLEVKPRQLFERREDYKLSPNEEKHPKNRLADVVQIVKNLNNENAELTDRVNELTERVESLETTNKTLTEQLFKLETIQKADIASMRTLIEVLRKELEEFKSSVSEQREDDEESEV